MLGALNIIHGSQCLWFIPGRLVEPLSVIVECSGVAVRHTRTPNQLCVWNPFNDARPSGKRVLTQTLRSQKCGSYLKRLTGYPCVNCTAMHGAKHGQLQPQLPITTAIGVVYRPLQRQLAHPCFLSVSTRLPHIAFPTGRLLLRSDGTQHAPVTTPTSMAACSMASSAPPSSRCRRVPWGMERVGQQGRQVGWAVVVRSG